MKLFTRASFLIPTLKKLLIATALFLILGWVVWPTVIELMMTDWYPVGFPLTIYAKGYCPPTYICVEFRWAALIIDGLFWYLLTAILVHARVGFWTSCLYFLGAILGIILVTVFLLLINGPRF